MSDMQTIKVHTNFTNSVELITNFELDDLAPEKLVQFHSVWTDPSAFRAAQMPQQATARAAQEVRAVG